MRRESEIVRKREKEISDLYAFSRRLAAGHSTSDIFDAIQKHLSTVVGRRVALFEPRGPAEGKPEPIGESDVPQNVRDAVDGGHRRPCRGGRHADRGRSRQSLAGARRVARRRPTSASSPSISAGRRPKSEEEIRARIEAVLHDAASTLEQIGLAHAITEVRMRAESERFRDALIGSVSHELRTPLASILGAATVLCNAPAVAGEPRLAALANVVRDESERLNNEIQNLLDATRITGEALQPKLEWAEVADVVNTAVERRRGPLRGACDRGRSAGRDAARPGRRRPDREGARTDHRQCRQIFAARLADQDSRMAGGRHARARGERPGRRSVGGGQRASGRAVFPRPAARVSRRRAPDSDFGSPTHSSPPTAARSRRRARARTRGRR